MKRSVFVRVKTEHFYYLQFETEALTQEGIVAEAVSLCEEETNDIYGENSVMRTASIIDSKGDPFFEMSLMQAYRELNDCKEVSITIKALDA